MLTVIMATYNGAATLPAVLDAYCALAAPPSGWRLLIVDNGSADDTPAVIARYAARLPLTCLTEPRRGKNVALNHALPHALAEPTATLLVFSDDDAAPDPDWLLRLSEAAHAQPDYAVFGGSIVPAWSHPPPDWLLRLVPLGLTYGATSADLPDGPVFPGLVWGANMALRRSVFDAGYRFDESVGPNGGNYVMGSETQLTRRLAVAGYRSWFCPRARVTHFIRPYQLTATFVLARARRFGRGKCRQDAAAAQPQPWQLPRWMLKQFAWELLSCALAMVTRRRDQAFRHRWELAYLRGYIGEAWFGPRPPGRHVLITSYSGELGGMELRMAQEARFLAEAGYRSTLAVRRFPGLDAWADSLNPQQIPVAIFDPPPFFEQWRWRRLNKWRAEWLTARTLRQFRSDLVHVAFCWNHYGASALWLARRCGLPAVISVHNAFPSETICDWHRPLLHDAFRGVRGIYAVSESAMRHFLALYQDYVAPSTRLAVIPNCVDLARFRPSADIRRTARLQLGLPPDALVIGSVARLSEQKRPLALLRLLARLRPEFPSLHLVLVGTGPLDEAVREQVRQAGLEQRVVFTGFVPAVEQLLPALDLHLLLSRNEGFGIATIEAMACGVPAIATDVPGSADLLCQSRGGALVPLHDEAATAATVGALLRDTPRRLEMGRQARAEVATRYASEVVAGMVQSFYRGLI